MNVLEISLTFNVVAWKVFFKMIFGCPRQGKSKPREVIGLQTLFSQFYLFENRHRLLYSFIGYIIFVYYRTRCSEGNTSKITSIFQEA